jgi:hypothetical protein
VRQQHEIERREVGDRIAGSVSRRERSRIELA